jgi:SPP1 gp7 family putative phage head morphogenesis protein
MAATGKTIAMLINVSNARTFDRYLRTMEQKLHLAKFPIMRAAYRMQLTRGGLAAQKYIEERGQPTLIRYYKKIYADIYEAVVDQLPETKARRRRTSQFVADQLQWIEQRATRQIARISQSASDDVRDIIMRGIREGMSDPEIAASLYDDIEDLSRGRAATIARTETHSAANAAMWETLDYEDVDVRTKTWVTVGDDVVRPSHQALEGETLGIDEAFEGESGAMMFPGDDSLGAGAADIVNCRCSVIYNT